MYKWKRICLEYILIISICFCCAASPLLRRFFSSCRECRLPSTCGVGASHCDRFSVVEHGLYGARASAVGARGLSSCGFPALEHRLSSCACVWGLPRPGIKPRSPALAVGFFTTEPPRKPQSIALDRVKGCRLRHRIPLLRVVLMGAGNEISKGKTLERKKA